MKSHIIGDTATMAYSHPREFIEQAQRSSSKTRASHTGSKGFTGTSSFEEAVDIATNGWEPTKMQDIAKAIVGRADGVKIKRVLSDSNGSLNIDRYTQGMPKTLKSWKRKAEKSKRITLAINVGENANVDADVLFNKAAMLVAIAELCAKSNIQTEIFWTESARCRGYFSNMPRGVEYYASIVPIKRFNERLQIHKIGGMLHPSCFRRLWFGIAENTDKDFEFYSWGKVDEGYGQSTKSADMAAVKAIKDIYGRKNVIHIPSASELDLYDVDDALKSAQKILNTIHETIK